MTFSGGILLIDKPIGPTSHDVVAHVRRTLQTRRVGHAGTLDPDASGLLLICVEEATRILEYMTATDKSYTGEIVFGIGTDTDDASGTVIATASTDDVDDDDIQNALLSFLGTTMQEVPAYSAVHIDGVRAYELARAGQKVTMPSREVHISSLIIGHLYQEGELVKASFEVSCSKGTYIRALCRDIGRRIGVPAHMGSLRRTAVGRATLEEAISLQAWMAEAHPEQSVKPVLPFLHGHPTISVKRSVMEHLANGQRVVAPKEVESSLQSGEIVFIQCDDELAAVALLMVEGQARLLQPKKVFWKRG